MTNRLAQESSPYLLQHQHNPVDWHPWGTEAIELARQADRPIFLSIGYSACHWCHVMEHESFENPRIAQLMNEYFVNVKVDREERPDLDQVYMQAVQMMTGRGGWPMSVFLTPDLQPFFGGTYWPPEGRMGMAGFDQVLSAVHDAWQNRRQQALDQASQLTQQIQLNSAPEAAEGKLSEELMHQAGAALERLFDFRHGGFGGAPKFPHPLDLRLLLRLWKRTGRDGLRQMATTTLDKMAGGGIYDHLGGGFHRYAVDDRWLVPHFEKMLYDNALLALAYTEAHLATGNTAYRRVARETLDYVLREMTDPSGGFYSTEDADSEGQEGKFYVWSLAELNEILGEEAAATFAYVYDVTADGNFEGENILNLPKTVEQCAAVRRIDLDQLRAALDRDRRKLFAVRAKRVRPGLDDKVLVAWNGLMIDALALAAGALDEPRYLQAAQKSADFILAKLRREDGRLLHCWRQGQAKFDAYLDDYASLTNALLSLYEASFDERYLDEAIRLADLVLRHFANRDGGGFFFTADDHERLVARVMDLQDSSVPSGNALMATALLRLARFTGRDDFWQSANATLQSAVGLLERSPTAAGQMLLALDFYLGPTPEIAIVAQQADTSTAELLADLRRRFIPNKIVALRPPRRAEFESAALEPLFAGKRSEKASDSEPAVYLCQRFACQTPLHGAAAAISRWTELAEIGK